jgi:hypothetical protein
MSSTPAKLLRLDTYRDGGSISASFKREGDNRFTLFLDRILGANDEVVGYRKPVLEVCIHNIYTSPTTGVSMPDLKWETHPSSWEEAKSILEELRPQVAEFESDYRWVFPTMVYAAENNGAKLKSETDRIR